MSNPYQSPLGEQFANSASQSQATERQSALSAVSGPAIGLIVVSVISVGLLALTIAFDTFLLVSGVAAHMPPDGDDDRGTIVFRTIWGLTILVASAYCIYGAWQMRSLRSFQHAWTAAIIAVIPCLGPCCVLGLPFGAWALAILAKPEIRSRFES